MGRKQLDAMNSIKKAENEGKLGVSGRGSKQRKQHVQEPSCSRLRDSRLLQLECRGPEGGRGN